MRASRCSTWSGGSSTPAGSTSSWPSSVSAAAPRPARQPRPVRQGGRRVPGHRRRRDAAGAAGLARGRGRPRQRPRRRDADARPTRSSCSPCIAPRDWSGTRSSSSGVCAREVPEHPQSRRSGPPASAILPVPLRGDERDLPQAAAHDKAGATPSSSRRRRSTRRKEELRLGYVALTRARHRLSCRRTSGTTNARRRSGPRRTRRRSGRRPGRVGGGADRVAGQAGEGDAQPAAGRCEGSARGRSPSAPRRRCAGSRQPSSCRMRWPTSRRVGDRVRPRPRRQLRRSPTGTRSWTGCSAEARRDRSAEVEVPLPPACPRPRWPGCVTIRRRSPATLARPMPRRAVTGGAVRHQVPRLGRGAVRSAGPVRPRGAPGSGRQGHRRRGRPGRARRGLRVRSVRRPGPARQVEPPFALVLAGQVVRGRIDAIYRERRRLPRRRLEDQPESRPPTRCSWRSTGSRGRSCTTWTLEQVRAGFYYVRTGTLVEPEDLPGRPELERLVGGA